MTGSEGKAFFRVCDGQILFSCLPAQVNTGAKLLHDIRTDLGDVVQVCETKKKQTNYLRGLISDLAKGELSLAVIGLHCSF